MGTIHEVAAGIQAELNPSADESIERFVAAAQERVARAEERVGFMLSDSQAVALLQRLGGVANALRDVQGMLQGVHEAERDLYASWGVALQSGSRPLYAVSSSSRPVGRPKVEKTSGRQDTSHNAESNPSVEELIESLGLSGREKACATSVRFTLQRHGLRSVHDILATGKEVLARLPIKRPFGTEARIAVLENAIHARFPDVTIPDRADPAATARTHRSLQDVPYLALGHIITGYEGTYSYGQRCPTVHDILTAERRQLFRGALSEGEFRDLRRQAREYAAAFMAAKRQQTA